MEALIALIVCNADVEHESRYGITAVQEAVSCDRSEVVRILTNTWRGVPLKQLL